jgi:DNA-binding transcriptional regulator YbjK
MTVDEMQLVLSRVYAIAALDPKLGELAASLERSLRKLVEARVTREGFRSPVRWI